MSLVIEVSDLGKKYMISHQGEPRYQALRDVISDGAKRLVKKGQPVPRREEFWALRHASFSIYEGDKIGIIGRNGAGKTTILKLLSRVTSPSEGKIKIKGKISSLLEVGTGFHPELTGRENIFFNGAVLGMSRIEIKKKFDEIVEFAEVEKFLDTPVKRYSSGMFVRLAFAVAAHLDAEILLIDEVLAVGDLKFQEKCLGRMDDISTREGRTILFVSHNMAMIRNLCERGILLDNGEIVEEGNMEDVISAYEYKNVSEGSLWKNKRGIEEINFLDVQTVSFLDEKLNRKRTFFNSEKIIVKFDFYVNEPHSQMKIQIYLNKHGELVFTYPFFLSQKEPLTKGYYTLYSEIPPYLLSSGRYFLNLNVSFIMCSFLLHFWNIYLL